MTARRAAELLAALHSQVRRPRLIHEPPARKPASLGTCRLCSSPVTWVTMPSGRRAPLDHNPAGELVVIDGTALEYSETRDRERRRFSLHVGQTCREAQGRRA